MVQLRIDGQEAAIKKGTNFQLTFENSYFAKGNTWSFDIELPLDDQRNAAIFGAINRHDVRQKPQTHTAELIVPGMNHIVGSVVVTKVTETSVSIQLASTRDAIDTKVANRYIHEMDITKKNMTNLGIHYTDFPVCDTEGTTEVGNYIVQLKEKKAITAADSDVQFYKFTKISFLAAGHDKEVPGGVYHPYLYDVVMLLLKEAGYTVGTNALDTPMMRALVIVRATVRKHLCYHLPHWTFSEFVTEVERFAGVHFIFNNTTKVVNIVPVSATLTGSTSGSSTDFSTAAYNTDVVVVDELTAEIDTDTASVEATDTNGNNNIGYDLLGEHSDKYERLSDEVLAQANIIECTKAQMWAMHDAGTDNQKQLFLVDGQYYLPQPDALPFQCNRLHDIKTSDEADVELLRITPCAFTNWKFDVFEYTAFYEDTTTEIHTKEDTTMPSVRVPVAEGPEKQYSAVGYLLDSILENDDEEDDTETPEEATVMRVAFVDDVEQPVYFQCQIYGTKTFGAGYWQAKLPYTLPGLLMYDDNNLIDSPLTGDLDVIVPAEKAIKARPYTLELTARSAAGNGTAQSIKRLLPDTTIEYTKRIIAHSLPDVDKLFLIHGKRFICKSLTVEINEEGIVPLMEGTFYMFD